MRAKLSLLVACGAAAVLALTASAATQIPVRASRANERNPAAAPGYLAWSQSRRKAPHRYDAYVKAGTGRSFKINAPGTQGWIGGIDGTRLVYQEISQGQSDLKLYDLAGRTRSDLPVGFNTDDWEWEASISGDWVFFGRATDSEELVILRSLSTGEQRLLDGVPYGRYRYMLPGQVNGNFVVWAKHSDRRTSQITLYDIAGATTTKVPNPRNNVLYAASVTPTGTVYYMRSAVGCGKHVQLLRYVPGGTSKVLVTFRKGFDVYSTYAVAEPSGVTSVYYDRGRCTKKQTATKLDIYKVVDAPPAP